MSRFIRKAVLPVAGPGDAVPSCDESDPEGDVPIVDKPMVQIVVEEAVAAGMKDVIFITGRGKGEIESLRHRLRARGHAAPPRKESPARGARSDRRDDPRHRRPPERGEGPRPRRVDGARSRGATNPSPCMLGDDLVDDEVPCIEQLARVDQ